MQVGFMMQKALCELFILKSTKPLPIIFKWDVSMSCAVALMQSFLVLQVYVPTSKDLSLDLR